MVALIFGWKTLDGMYVPDLVFVILGKEKINTDLMKHWKSLRRKCRDPRKHH